MSSANSQDKSFQFKLKRIRGEQEEDQAKILAEKYKLPYINLFLIPISPDDLNILSERKAKKANVAVINQTGKNVKLAVLEPSDPQTTATVNELERQGYECKIFVASLSSIKKAWQSYQIQYKKSIPLNPWLFFINY